MNGDSLLEHLKARHSVRSFRPEPVPRAALERLLEAAITAPSATNRQPWRFTVVTSARLRDEMAAAVRARLDALNTAVRRGPFGDEVSGYSHHLLGPMPSAPALVLVQYRLYPDLLAEALRAAQADPRDFVTASAMQAELASTSAAIMAMLLQAEADGLGACWMSGPLIARGELEALAGIARPWQLLAVVAVGWPAQVPAATSRRPLQRVVEWLEDGASSSEM